MSAMAMIIVFVCLLVMLIGGVMCLVAAFRQHILWGLAYLLLPFASLVFCIMHWRDVKAPFLAFLIATAVCYGTLYNEGFRGLHIGSAAPHVNKVAELNTKIQNERDRIDQLQNDYMKTSNDVAQLYKDLTQKRGKLNTQDAAAVHSFNQAAATYQQQNAHANETKRALDTAQDELDNLLSERSKAASKQVVMYTTSHCPACKMAKSYFTQKGVNYRELDVEASRDALAEFQRLGGQGVPLILIGDKKFEGFNAQALDAALQD